MAFKFVILAAFVAVASAGVIPAASLAYHAAPAPVAYHAAAPVAYHTAAVAPVAYHAPLAKAVDADYDAHPQYNYGYDVQDSLTGDYKSQHESRDGDLVQGSYSLIEADGTRRIVDYTADDVNGFNAVVHKEPAQVAVKAVAHAPLAYAAAPVAKIAHAPVAYAAPVVHAAPYAQAPLSYYHH